MATYPIIEEKENLIVEVGTQGPPGLNGTNGVDGQGFAIVSESEPLLATEGEIWFNPTTKVEKIYALGVWQNTSVDGQNF